MLVFALILPSAAMAQPPDMDRGGVLVDYAHWARACHRMAACDLRRTSGSVLRLCSWWATCCDGAALALGRGCSTISGRLRALRPYAFRRLEHGHAAADTASKLKHGGGVEVPIKDGLILRIGVESTPHPDGTMRASTVGVGWRF